MLTPFLFTASKKTTCRSYATKAVAPKRSDLRRVQLTGVGKPSICTHAAVYALHTHLDHKPISTAPFSFPSAVAHTSRTRTRGRSAKVILPCCDGVLIGRHAVGGRTASRRRAEWTTAGAWKRRSAKTSCLDNVMVVRECYYTFSPSIGYREAVTPVQCLARCPPIRAQFCEYVPPSQSCPNVHH